MFICLTAARSQCCQREKKSGAALSKMLSAQLFLKYALTTWNVAHLSQLLVCI